MPARSASDGLAARLDILTRRSVDALPSLPPGRNATTPDGTPHRLMKTPFRHTGILTMKSERQHFRFFTSHAFHSLISAPVAFKIFTNGCRRDAGPDAQLFENSIEAILLGDGHDIE